jgi:hypothetical protein
MSLKRKRSQAGETAARKAERHANSDLIKLQSPDDGWRISEKDDWTVLT